MTRLASRISVKTGACIYLHPLRNFNAHEIESFGQRLPDEFDDREIEHALVRVFLADDAIAVIEEAENLRQSERVFSDACRLQRCDHLGGDIVKARGRVHDFPYIVGGIEKTRHHRFLEETLDSSEVEIRFGFQELDDDVVSANGGVLQIRTG